MSIRKAVGRLFSVLWTGVDAVRKILHLLILLMIFSVVIGALSSTGPLIPKNAALVIRPVGNIVEQLEGDPYDRALAELMDDADAQTLVQDMSMVCSTRRTMIALLQFSWTCPRFPVVA
jgi:protease-4